MKPHPERAWRSVQVLISLVFISLWLVQGCGGSGGVDSGGTGAAPPTLAVGPISGYGSIVVAGVHYDETSARIVDGDDQLLPASALTLGSMTSIDASAVASVGTQLQAKAQTIRVAEILIGPVEAVDSVAQTLRVLGQPVTVTAGTVFDSSLVGSLSAVRVGTVLAVHGQIDTAGARNVATRIEPRANAARYVVRAPLSSYDRAAKRLSLGSLNVNLADITTLPDTLANGAIVRLKLRTTAVLGTWTATELRQDNQPVPDRDNVEIEGRISAFTSAQRFSVDGSAVDATSATVSGGTPALGVRVEVEGRSSAGMIVARRVVVDAQEGGGAQAIELEGRIALHDPALKTFVVRGITVSYAGTPAYVVGSAADIRNDRMVNVKGKLAADRSRVDATVIHLEL